MWRSVLEVAEHSFAPSTDTLGAGGMQLWKFRAVSAGITRLKLEQRRSWERKTIDTFDVIIRVTA